MLANHSPHLRAATALFGACIVAGCTAAPPRGDGTPATPLGALATGLRPTVLKAGEPLPGWSLQQRMQHYRVPGVAIAIVRDGVVIDAAGYGERAAGGGEAVDADTLFSVGSVSKVVTAAVSLRLVAQGRLALDRDVGDDLTTWSIPATDGLGTPPVTLRMLLSHTSGLGVHGFEDYPPGAPLPGLLETLQGRPPAKNEAVRLQHAPGARMDYSGGGVMVEQLLLETVAGQPLDVLARTEVFAPLGMQRSTFADPARSARGNIAKAHDASGAPTASPRGWESFPEAAASGLWTSANELGAFVGALLRSYRGGDALLPRAVAAEMMTEVAPSWHGLGPRLDGAGATRIFHHGGANDSYRAWIEGYLDSGDGFVILTNGAGGGALMMEIRNALSDALARGVNPPIRTIPVPALASHADLAGEYRLDPGMPMSLRRGLVDYFDADRLVVETGDGALSLAEAGGRPIALLPLAPNRFVMEGSFDPPRIEFHRDASGKISGLSVQRGSAQAWYPREAAGPKAIASARGELDAVVEAFRRAVITKDRARFATLFLREDIPWQDVKSDADLARIAARGRAAVKVKVDRGYGWRQFIDGIAASEVPQEERLRNLRLETDGDIASLWFDYSFHEDGRETNHGREAWQLVRTAQGWKIASVVYSVTRPADEGR